MKKLGFVLKPELCIQCHACETACRNWRQPEGRTAYRKVIAVEHGTFPDTKLTFYSLGCLHCTDPACMNGCPVDAISKNELGAVLVDRDVCIGCGLCAENCPYGIPQFTEDGRMHKCDLCLSVPVEAQRSPCVRMCPTQALTLVEMTREEKQAEEKKIPRK